VQQIVTDGIDILVDIAGHTAHNKLTAFAFKPAPVQVTYLGYPNTTGLSAIDYRLTDSTADPEGQGRYYTERLVRLPGCFLCYLPLADAPPLTPLPAAASGRITFGSFNNLSKMSPDVVGLWSRLVQAVPGSRLLVKNSSLSDESVRARYREQFRAQGLEDGQLELVGHTPTREEHLAMYGQLDIALDTFPYNGTTTTCEALWMGVPVVTLKGEVHAARVGATLLNSVGLPELVADSPDDFLRVATDLALDTNRLGQQRAGLRQRLSESSLCDGDAFARKVEQAYRDMWVKWCGQGEA
jgi:predicted O-linked N-acetylglucosamine transferase (SPINDLY family)